MWELSRDQGWTMPKPARLTGQAPQPQIGVRVPPELKEALDKAANAADRTLAAECERRLRRSFSVEDLIDDGLAEFDKAGADADRLQHLAERALTRIYGKEAAETAAVLATSIAVLSNMTHFKFRDEKVRKLLVTACLAHLDHVKAVIREIEASAT